MVQKIKKALKQKKRKCTEELHILKKMSVSDSDQESIISSSSEEGEVLKFDLGEMYIFINNHNSKNLKQHTESFLI